MKRIVISLSVSALCAFALHARAADNEAPRAPIMEPELTGRPSVPEMPEMPEMPEIPRMPAMPPGHPAVSGAPQQSAATVTGTVLETMDAGSYTYVRVKIDEQELWAAGLKVPVKVGDTVSFSKGMEMKDFRSDQLDRTFESIYFVDAIDVGGREGASAAPANPHGRVNAVADVAVAGIAPAEGGKTVKDLYEEKTSLSGKSVVLRAKIVKVNLAVMGKNWFHLRDGTTAGDGKNDLTVTSTDTAAVGDIVLVRGNVVTDKDFGFGYRYDVMIEDAKLTVD